MNNKKSISKNTKKHSFIFILISGVIAIFLLIIIVFFIKKPYRADLGQTTSESNQPANEKETGSETNNLPVQTSSENQKKCPFYDKQNNLITLTGKAKFSRGEDLQFEKLDQVPQDYVIKLWKKGYHWLDILQLWGWKIPEVDIPDLTSEKRIGVINSLFVMVNFWKGGEDWTGETGNCVVIVRKIPGNGINIDSGCSGSMHSWDKPSSASDNIKKIIKLAFELEKLTPANYQITILNAIGIENFGQEKKVSFGNADGKSAGSAVYLALLSALHKKPIARSVAAAGRISGGTKKAKTAAGAEIDLPAGTNLPIQGLKAKIAGAVEKGINRFVLSKYQCSPNLLSLISKNKYYDNDNNFHVEESWKLKDDYQKEVPPEVKDKVRKIYWAENISELRELILGGKLS